MRTGLIAEKLGMSRIFAADGVHVPVTVLQVDGCQVINVRTQETDGYDAVQIGAGKIKVKNVSKPMRGHFAKSKVEPKRKVVEFRVSKDAMLEVAAELSAAHFVEGQFVDVVSTSMGKGFAGPMKRHNFSGLEASHGVSISHRSHGSTGNRQDPGRVFKNKKMAGHMGDVRVTTQNLKVISVDEARGLIFVKGAVPGKKGTTVLVKDALKKALPDNVPMPAAFRQTAGAKVAAAPAQVTEQAQVTENNAVETPVEQG